MTQRECEQFMQAIWSGASFRDACEKVDKANAAAKKPVKAKTPAKAKTPVKARKPKKAPARSSKTETKEKPDASRFDKEVTCKLILHGKLDDCVVSYKDDGNALTTMKRQVHRFCDVACISHARLKQAVLGTVVSLSEEEINALLIIIAVYEFVEFSPLTEKKGDGVQMYHCNAKDIITADAAKLEEALHKQRVYKRVNKK